MTTNIQTVIHEMRREVSELRHGIPFDSPSNQDIAARLEGYITKLQLTVNEGSKENDTIVETIGFGPDVLMQAALLTYPKSSRSWEFLKVEELDLTQSTEKVYLSVYGNTIVAQKFADPANKNKHFYIMFDPIFNPIDAYHLEDKLKRQGWVFSYRIGHHIAEPSPVTPASTAGVTFSSRTLPRLLLTVVRVMESNGESLFGKAMKATEREMQTVKEVTRISVENQRNASNV